MKHKGGHAEHSFGEAKNHMYENPYNEVDSEEDTGEGAIYNDHAVAERYDLKAGDLTSSPNSESGSGIYGGSEPDHPSPMNVGFSPFKRAAGIDPGMPSGGGKRK